MFCCTHTVPNAVWSEQGFLVALSGQGDYTSNTSVSSKLRARDSPENGSLPIRLPFPWQWTRFVLLLWDRETLPLRKLQKLSQGWLHVCFGCLFLKQVLWKPSANFLFSSDVPQHPHKVPWGVFDQPATVCLSRSPASYCFALKWLKYFDFSQCCFQFFLRGTVIRNEHKCMKCFRGSQSAFLITKKCNISLCFWWQAWALLDFLMYYFSERNGSDTSL